MISPASLIIRFHERTSLTVKIVLTTVIIGLSLWAVLDYVQSSKLKKIFYIQLVERLTTQAMDDRIHFDRNINFYHRSVKLFVTQRNLSDYVENQNWSTDGPVQIKYHRESPIWFPKPSILRIFAHPRYAMLLDPVGRVREVYKSRDDLPPLSLLKPSSLILLKSRGQSLITELDNTLYLIASSPYRDARGKLSATLMLVTPIDYEFLLASSSTFTPGRHIALASWDKELRILASSNPAELPTGTPLSALAERYVITGQQTYDYGAAEYLIKLVSFISKSEIDKLTNSVIATGRHQRNIIAPVFILTFTLIMLWVTQRINRLKNRMSDFSEKYLGMQKKEMQKGDQLFVLEKRFNLFSKEILDAREKLKKQAEEKTRLIVDNAFDAIVTLDARGIITTWNPQAETVFGWSREQAVGKRTFETIVPQRYRSRYEKALRDFLDTGEAPLFNRQIQITALKRNGDEFPIELAISPAQSDDAHIFIAIIRDITERRQVEDELTKHRKHLQELVKERTAKLSMANEQLQKEIVGHKRSEEKKAQLLKEVESINKELKDFAYIVSHDLKAPLRAISTLANWITTDYADKLDEDGKEQLELLISRAGRMHSLINSILEYSKVGRIREEKTEVNMNEVVVEVIDMIAPPNNIEITIENKLPSIVCEKTRIAEVFQNLLSNAIRYMNKPEGIIKISCTGDNGYWKFSVSDNGPGIEGKYFKKIFQIFQTLSPLDEHENTGIGLTLVKKIITMYGGDIWVESEINKGSTFFFTLPKEI
ncbi:MAG: ATP-binding protein [Nitrospirota bacterium]